MAELRADVVVVGAGPAGVAACVAAAQSRHTVILIDENRHPGGQIGRMDVRSGYNKIALDCINSLHGIAVDRMYRSTVIDAPEPGRLGVLREDEVCEVRYRNLVLATGSRERFVPFPGWTLPGVMGAGGAQALAKSGVDFTDRRIAVSGTGPLLFAVGAYLQSYGAHITAVYEQAPWDRIRKFGLRLLADPERAMQAFDYWRALRPARYRPGTWVTSVRGARWLEEITLTDGIRSWNESVEFLACGYGLVANTELAALIGCSIADGAVVVDDDQRTSVPNVFAAGEATGIGGTDVAIAEGYVAGALAAERSRVRDLHKNRRDRLLPFVRLMNNTFELRPELADLADDDTIVCRCEDVRLGSLRGCSCRRQAKLETRLGMGPCQGRICGPATEFLFGWSVDSVRPPLVPVGVEMLATGLTSGASATQDSMR